MARVSARVIFVCRVVLGETLSVDWRERRLMGRTPSVTACRLCQLPRRGRPWQRGQVSSSFVNGRKKPLLSCKLSAFAKASPFRERWHGEAVTERVSPRLAAAFGKHFSQSESGQNRKKRLCRRHAADFVRRPPLWGPGWNPGRASRASKVAGAFLVLFWRAKENIPAATLCFVKVVM